MNTKPETLKDLILNRKRDRSYETLARESGDVLTRSNLQRMATTTEHKGLPTLKVIQALSKVLAVPEYRVFAAAGASVGLSASASGDLVIHGGLGLPSSSQQMLLDMAEHLRWWNEQVEGARDQLDEVKDELAGAAGNAQKAIDERFFSEEKVEDLTKELKESAVKVEQTEREVVALRAILQEHGIDLDSLEEKVIPLHGNDGPVMAWERMAADKSADGDIEHDDLPHTP